jgi:hypothetical protein
MILNERPAIFLNDVLYWLPLQTFFLLKVFIQPGLFLAYDDALRRLPEIIGIRKKRNLRPPVLTVSEERELFTNDDGSYKRRILGFFRRL